MINRPMLVTWREPIPPEVRQAIEPYIEVWQHVVPLWCQELIFGWNPTNTENTLTSTSMYEYRWVKIFIHPSYLECTPEERSEDFLHECLHAALEPLQNHARIVEGHIARDGDREMFREISRQAVESVVCDLTRALLGPRATRQ